jgi:cystathionine beta-synthase
VETYDSVIDLIGNTPLVRLHHVVGDAIAPVFAKVEYLNPGGSVKDRIALRMVDAAEREGLLKPGGTIVEPTSGNTGVGLALVAQQRGYSCVFVVPDKVSMDKINVLKAYGAEVVVCPTAVPPEHPDSYYNVSDRLAREIPGAWKPDQYSNPNNPLSHYEQTGPEIWRQTDGRITHFVAGVGTGGTITGCGHRLKELNPKLRCVAVEPAGSPVLSGGKPGPHKIQGIGAGFVPEILDTGVIDEVVTVEDAQALAMAREAARREGLFIGISSGAALHVALGLAARPEFAKKRIVTIIPSFGERYLSSVLYADLMD